LPLFIIHLPAPRLQALLLLYLPFVGADSFASAALPADDAKYQLEDYQPETYSYAVVYELEDEPARGTHQERECAMLGRAGELRANRAGRRSAEDGEYDAEQD
jgi:hypothetical protein